jgi:hypothetical protein
MRGALASSGPERLVRRLVASLGTVLVAAAIAAGSGASFNATTANTANTIKAGIVSFETSTGSSAVLTTTALAPGHSDSDSVDIVNTGDLAATFQLRAASVVDQPATPALSDKLDLQIQDVGDPACEASCPPAKTVYSGTLGAFTSAPLGTWAPDAKHRIRFTVTFPDGGAGADNSFQNARSTVDVTWTARG